MNYLHWPSAKAEMLSYLRGLQPTPENNKAKLEIFLVEGLTLDASSTLLSAGENAVDLLLVCVESVHAGKLHTKTRNSFSKKEVVPTTHLFNFRHCSFCRIRTTLACIYPSLHRTRKLESRVCTPSHFHAC